MLLQTARDCAIVESSKLKNKDQVIYIDWWEDNDYVLGKNPNPDSHFGYLNGIEININEDFDDCPF